MQFSTICNIPYPPVEAPQKVWAKGPPTNECRYFSVFIVPTEPDHPCIKEILYYKPKIQVKISYKTTITILYVISLWDADRFFLLCQVF